MSKSNFVAVAILGALILTFSLAMDLMASRMYLDFSSPNFRKIPIAVPAFINGTAPASTDSKGQHLATLLADAIDFHGFARIVPAASHGWRQDADWKSLAADFVVLATINEEKGNTILEFRLLNVLENSTVLSRRFIGPETETESMVLGFCDEMVGQLTGTAGISRSRIAFISDESGHREVHVSDVLGRQNRRITRHHYLTVSPRFSPDGRFLSYTSYHRGGQILFLTDLAQSRYAQTVSQYPGLNLAPSWHPDGSTLALTLSKDGGPDLYLMTSRGKILRRLTEGAGANVSPSWAPDGKRLAFVSDRSGTPQIYILDTERNALQRLSFAGNDNTGPSWSPAEDSIAFASLVGNQYHLFTIPSSGGAPVRITSSAGNHESPCWSPDGRQIVFSLKRGKEQELATIFKNGTGERILFKLKGSQSYPQWSPRPKQ